MPSTVSLIFVSATLVASLVFTPISSYIATYISLGSMLIGAIVLRGRLGSVLRHPAYIAVFAGMLLLAITLPFVWQGPDDLVLIAAMLPVPLGIGLVVLIEVEPRFGSPLLLGAFSLFATVIAVGVALEDVYVMGAVRAGAGNNPIHFADLTTALGFFSMVGLFGTKSPWRLVFLLGPILAFEVVLLSETRGAMLGFGLVLALVLLLLAIWFRHAWKLLVSGALVLALAVGAIVYTTPDVSRRALSAFDDSRAAITAFVAGEGVDTPAVDVDPSTAERISLLRGGIGVFSQHPVFGVGTGQIISEARAYFPDGHEHLGAHLHSDPADFAAAAGTFGLVAYLLFLLAPFLRPDGNYGTDTRRAMVLGAVVLSGCYLTLGLTNAVFGVLPQTMLFGVLLACIVAMGRTSGGQLPHQALQ